MVLKNKTYEHDANEETWQLCFFLRRSCEKNPVDWTRKVAKFRPPQWRSRQDPAKAKKDH